MENGRLIAIGDIHGEYYKLENLIKKLDLKSNDTCVFTGDYIDLGEYSRDVVSRLIELSKEINCIFLKGNHEDLLLKAKNNNFKAVENWYLVGGDTTLKNYGEEIKDVFSVHGEFFENLKLNYMTKRYFFVHGGINPEKSFEEQTEQDFLWYRHDFVEKPFGLPQKIVFGHTSCIEPYIDKYAVGIDTGCGKVEDTKLTAFICYDEVFIQSDVVW